MEKKFKFHIVPVIVIILVLIIIFFVAKCGKKPKALSPKEVVTEILNLAGKDDESKFTQFFSAKDIAKKILNVDAEIWSSLDDDEKEVIEKVAKKVIFSKRKMYLLDKQWEIEKEVITESGDVAEVHVKITFSPDTIITKIIKLKKIDGVWSVYEFPEKGLLEDINSAPALPPTT